MKNKAFKKVALARVNYSQLYGVYDNIKAYKNRDILVPYQLLVLASHIRNDNCSVKVFDGEVELYTQEDLAQDMLDWEPDIVGLTATTPDIDLCIEVCKIIKENDNSIITVIGGPHASALPSSVAENDCVDYVVVGDGEQPLEDIVFNGRDIKEKIIVGKNQDVSHVPMPSHDLLNYDLYKFTDPHRGSMNTASVMSSRGCPFDCTFCFHNRNLRYRSIDSFIAEIEYLYREKNVRYFYVYDDTFLVSKQRILKIIDKIRELRISDAHFQCLTRGNLVDEDLIGKLREVNFVRVSMGIESGSDKVLSEAHKGVKRQDYIDACHTLKKFDIETRGSFIIGHPHDTEETIKTTIDFSKELELYHANFNIMTPYPGTQVYEMATRDEGIHFVKSEYAYKWDIYRRWGSSVICTDELSNEDLEFYQKEAQMEFYTQDKIYSYYHTLFKNGNTSKYFFRPLNFAWNRKYSRDIEFWEELGENK
jgi:anaerobic magnesium-protoporphyrin IX monomethyl ester cyclase